MDELVLGFKRPFSRSDYEIIGGLSELKRLKLWTDQIGHQDLMALSQLKQLEHLSLSADKIQSDSDIGFPSLRTLRLGCTGELCDLSFTKNCPNLFWIQLSGQISKRHFEQLASAPALHDMDLESTNVDDSFLKPLLGLNLKSIQFGEKQISKATFDSLGDAGIGVGHYGLREFAPSHNYLRIGDQFYEIDRAEGQLSATVVPGDKFVRWSFSISTDPRYAPSGQYPTFQSPEFKIDKGIDGLVGTKTTEVVDPKWGGLDNGIHLLPVGHQLDFVSRDMNRFTVVCDFQSEANGGHIARIDTEMDFTDVIVRTEIRCSIAEATAAVAKHFDLSRFEQPVRLEKTWKPMIKFALKQQHRKPPFQKKNPTI